MTTATLTRPVPRIALTKTEAAISLGMSLPFFVAEVLPDLKVVRLGRKVLVPVSALEDWTADHAALTLGERAA